MILPVLTMLLACKDKEVDYAFPDGVEPLEENTASWPADMAEEISTVVGEEDEYHWAHSKAYVHADINDVYLCLRAEEVNVDRREIADWSVTADVEEGYEFSYAIWNQTYPTLGVEVEYTDTWRHGSTLDEDGALALVVTSWKMTEGNDYMYLKENSVVTEVAEEGITSLDMVGHLSAALRDGETTAQYYADLHADLVACVDGTDYPTFE
ncbi:MAG: hypothetical protein ACI8RZ_005237 [Myxococcota bacterium]|jgi:hypothetical protein